MLDLTVTKSLFMALGWKQSGLQRNVQLTMLLIAVVFGP